MAPHFPRLEDLNLFRGYRSRRFTVESKDKDRADNKRNCDDVSHNNPLCSWRLPGCAQVKKFKSKKMPRLVYKIDKLSANSIHKWKKNDST